MGISAALGSSALLPGGLGFRNLIINGEVLIDQRATTATVNTGASYAFGPDRWLGLGTASAGVFTIARSTTEAPSGFRSSLVAQCTTLDSSLISTDNYQILTHLEGFNTADLGYGTSWAKQTWLTFWVRSSKAGTYSVSLRNNAINRSFVAEYTIDSVNTWEFKRIQIFGDTTGTWVIDNGLGLRVAWSLGCGSDGTTSTLNSWQAANKVASANQTNWMDSQTSRFFYLTGVQLEQNIQPTPFEQRPYGVELALCQRYFERLNVDNLPRVIGYTNFNSAVYNCYVMVRTTQKMRGTVAVSASTGGVSGGIFNTVQNTSYTNGGLNYSSQGDQGFFAYTVNAVGSANGQMVVQSGTIYDISAEL